MCAPGSVGRRRRAHAPPPRLVHARGHGASGAGHCSTALATRLTFWNSGISQQFHRSTTGSDRFQPSTPMPLESSTKSLAMFGGKPSQRTAARREGARARTPAPRVRSGGRRAATCRGTIGPLADVGGRFARRRAILPEPPTGRAVLDLREGEAFVIAVSHSTRRSSTTTSSPKPARRLVSSARRSGLKNTAAGLNSTSRPV